MTDCQMVARLIDDRWGSFGRQMGSIGATVGEVSGDKWGVFFGSLATNGEKSATYREVGATDWEGGATVWERSDDSLGSCFGRFLGVGWGSGFVFVAFFEVL